MAPKPAKFSDGEVIRIGQLVMTCADQCRDIDDGVGIVIGFASDTWPIVMFVPNCVIRELPEDAISEVRRGRD